MVSRVLVFQISNFRFEILEITNQFYEQPMLFPQLWHR